MGEGRGDRLGNKRGGSVICENMRPEGLQRDASPSLSEERGKWAFSAEQHLRMQWWAGTRKSRQAGTCSYELSESLEPAQVEGCGMWGPEWAGMLEGRRLQEMGGACELEAPHRSVPSDLQQWRLRQALPACQVSRLQRKGQYTPGSACPLQCQWPPQLACLLPGVCDSS